MQRPAPFGDDDEPLEPRHRLEERRRRRPGGNGEARLRVALDEMREQPGRQHGIADPRRGDEEDPHGGRVIESRPAIAKPGFLPSRPNQDAAMSRQDANAAFARSSFLYGGNAPYIEDAYARFQRDPKSVDAEWQAFFQSLNGSIQASRIKAWGRRGGNMYSSHSMSSAGACVSPVLPRSSPSTTYSCGMLRPAAIARSPAFSTTWRASSGRPRLR